MKKKTIFFIVFILAILNFSILTAQLNTSEEQKRVDKAYSCLENKTKGKCSSLSVEEKVFSLLSVSQCQSELLSSSNNGECWPVTQGGTCKIKTTAQAILALNNVKYNTDKSEKWLLNQNRTATGLEWYLEIESSSGNSGTASCKIEYSGQSFTVNIGSDKKLDNNAGPCLALAQDNYWLRISPSCYNTEFSVSCNETFLTTLLFKKAGTQTINVFGEVSSAASQGTTKEKVESFCFAEAGVCNYEGSLWASLVLSSQGYDVSQYMPYLISFSADNQRFLPDAFLFFITSDLNYKTSLLSKQKSNKYWLESGDRFYDTALALYPFQQETDIQQKTNSKNWLLSSQDSNGCWEDNIRNTAFILASVWPRAVQSTQNGVRSCEDAGYSCTIPGDCEGKILSQYDCRSGYVCCSQKKEAITCSKSKGIICSSNQRCIGGTIIVTPDLNYGEVCCVEGSCQEKTPRREENISCQSKGGVCRTSRCESNETVSRNYTCTYTSDYCCLPKTNTKQTISYTWIWILLILIALVVLGIIFRHKLRIYWLKIKDRFGKKGQPKGGPPTYPPQPPYMSARPPERRVIMRPKQPPLVQQRSQLQVGRQITKPKSGTQQELDEVLKKLKDMSK